MMYLSVFLNMSELPEDRKLDLIPCISNVQQYLPHQQQKKSKCLLNKQVHGCSLVKSIFQDAKLGLHYTFTLTFMQKMIRFLCSSKLFLEFKHQHSNCHQISTDYISFQIQYYVYTKIIPFIPISQFSLSWFSYFWLRVSSFLKKSPHQKEHYLKQQQGTLGLPPKNN